MTLTLFSGFMVKLDKLSKFWVWLVVSADTSHPHILQTTYSLSAVVPSTSSTSSTFSLDLRDLSSTHRTDNVHKHTGMGDMH